MTNQEIIASVAIAEGIFNDEEIMEMIEEGIEIPLHTLQGWSIRGRKMGKELRIKKGEHGIETRLWKRRDKNDKLESKNAEGEEKKGDFYLAKAFLFRADQVEEVQGTAYSTTS